MTLKILKDETIISQKYGPIRLTSGTEIEPLDLGLDKVTVDSLIGRGVAIALEATLTAPAGADMPVIHASPAAVTLAEEHEIDLSAVVGTGKEGNILKSDVETLPFEKPVSSPEVDAPKTETRRRK